MLLEVLSFSGDGKVTREVLGTVCTQVRLSQEHSRVSFLYFASGDDDNQGTSLSSRILCQRRGTEGSQATSKQYCAASERAEAAGSVQRELAALLQSSVLIFLPAPGIF